MRNKKVYWLLKHRQKKWHTKNTTISVYTALTRLYNKSFFKVLYYIFVPTWKFYNWHPGYGGRFLEIQFSFSWFGIGFSYEHQKDYITNEDIEEMIRQSNPEDPYFGKT